MRLRLSIPVKVGILLTLAFNVMPVWLGFSGLLLAAFVPYALAMLFLSLLDEEVLAYGAALCVCNASNAVAYVSFGLLMSCLAILRGHRMLGTTIGELARSAWWPIFLAAAACFLFIAPTWSFEERGLVTEAKGMASRIGFLVLFPLAIGTTMRNRQSALFALFLVGVTAVATLAVFHYFGTAGVSDELGQGLRMTARARHVRIGQANLNMNRTSVCIILAGLAASLFALGAGSLPRIRRVVIAFAASAVAVLLVMQLASTGSALAMVIAMGTVVLGRLLSRSSGRRVLGSIVIFSLCGTALVWAVFYTENRLAERIDEKLRGGHIDRWPLWTEAARTIMESPMGVGRGFTTQFTYGRDGHNDFFNYFLSYGWIGGTLYLAGCVWLFGQLIRAAFRARSLDAETGVLVSAALAALTVYCANSLSDMISAHVGYYEILWALALIPSTALLQKTQAPLPISVAMESGLG